MLATNNGSLYYRGGAGARTFVFASENFILKELLEGDRLGADVGHGEGRAVRPGEGVLVALKTLAVTHFSFATAAPAVTPRRARVRAIEDRSPIAKTNGVVMRTPDVHKLDERFPYVSTTYTLKRCTRCVLPETMPYIDFDADGVCSYCRKHQPLKMRGRDALEEIVGPHRRTDGRPDCVLGISGGRDSVHVDGETATLTVGVAGGNFGRMHVCDTNGTTTLVIARQQ